MSYCKDCIYYHREKKKLFVYCEKIKSHVRRKHSCIDFKKK